jgi:cytochrome bd-type quinol oxidase subunit 1
MTNKDYELFAIVMILIVIGAIGYLLINDSGGHTTVIKKTVRMSWWQWLIYTVISVTIGVVSFDRIDLVKTAVTKLNQSEQTKPLAKKLTNWQKQVDKLLK